MSQYSGTRRHRERVVVNVYDLNQMNDHLHSFGLGAYHSGVEVHGTEYSFGGGPEGGEAVGSGVFTCTPREAAGAKYRESIVIGETSLLSSEVGDLVRGMESGWQASDYNVVTNNCNCFADALVFKLTGKHLPGWINRMARIGSMFECLLPKGMQGPSGTPSSSGGGRRQETRPAFGGTGHVLSSPTPASSSAASTSSPSASSQHRRQTGSTASASASSTSTTSSLLSSFPSASSIIGGGGGGGGGGASMPTADERRKLMAAAAARRAQLGSST